MSDIAIHVSGLSKRYKIGRLQRRHDTLRDRIADARFEMKGSLLGHFVICTPKFLTQTSQYLHLQC